MMTQEVPSPQALRDTILHNKTLEGSIDIKKLLAGESSTWSALKEIFTSDNLNSETERTGELVYFGEFEDDRAKFTAIYDIYSEPDNEEEGKNRLYGLAAAHTYDYVANDVDEVKLERFYDILKIIFKDKDLDPQKLGEKGDLNLIVEFISEYIDLIPDNSEVISSAATPPDASQALSMSPLLRSALDNKPIPAQHPKTEGQPENTKNDREQRRPLLAENKLGKNKVMLTQLLLKQPVRQQVVSRKSELQTANSIDRLFTDAGTIEKSSNEALKNKIKERRSLIYLVGLFYISPSSEFVEAASYLARNTELEVELIANALMYLGFLVEGKFGNDVLDDKIIIDSFKDAASNLDYKVSQLEAAITKLLAYVRENYDTIVEPANNGSSPLKLKELIVKGVPKYDALTAEEKDVLYLHSFLNSLDSAKGAGQEHRILDLQKRFSSSG